MKQRKIGTVDLYRPNPVLRLKKFYVDRLLAEDCTSLDVFIDDDALEVTLKPEEKQVK